MSSNNLLSKLDENLGELQNIRIKIIQDIIAPNYYEDVSELINSREKWRRVSNWFETIGKILMALSTIVAFASGYYNFQILSFIAGSLGTISMACQQFSIYSVNESKERNNQVNKILKDLNIKRLKDLTDVDDNSSDKTKKNNNLINLDNSDTTYNSDNSNNSNKSNNSNNSDIEA